MSDSCPKCGYCAHCGRGGYQTYPFYPSYPYPSYPYYTITAGAAIQNPTYTVSGTTAPPNYYNNLVRSETPNT